MKHVNAIKEMIHEGQIYEAKEALEDLLELGPNNIEALKLLAFLFNHQGKYEDEELVWRRVFEIDREDEDTHEYFQKVQLEDREHYYFTDVLPDGGRRFIAYPRALVNISLVGLLGCVAFLILTRLSTEDEMLNSPAAVVVSFLVLVVSPWVGIFYAWAKSLRSVQITRDNLEISTRFKSLTLAWQEIENIFLAHSADPMRDDLKLIITTRRNDVPAIAIDFSEKSSSIRARRHLINEIKDFYQPISYEDLDKLSLSKRSLLNF